MVRLMHRGREVLSEERGVVLVMTAFMFVGFLGIAALVIDIVVVNQAQIRAQATVDSAVLAAVQDFDNIPAAIAAAKEYAARNYDVTDADWAGCVDPDPLPVPTTENCISVDDPLAFTQIRVRLPSRSVSAVFAGVYGKSSFSISATANAEIEFGGGAPSDGDADDADFQQVADFLRAGDPGGGYDTCDPIPSWVDVDDLPPLGATKWGEYIFVFEHLDGTTQTVCGTSSDVTTDNSGKTFQWGMDTFVAGTGGDTYPGPGMIMHVSCSQNFIAQDGWDADGKGKGPIQGVDTEWHIVRYIGARYQVSEGKPGKKANPAEAGSGEIYIKNACGYEFTSVTSEPPRPTIIRLSD